VIPGSRKGAWVARDVVTSYDSSGARILLHLPSGTYLRLDESAARIVDLLNEDPDPGRAAARLADRFDIPVERALGDVNAVISTVYGQVAPRTHRGRLPTLTGVVAVTRGWRRLPPRFRWATLRAATVVMVIEVGLAVSNLPRVARTLGVPLATDQDAAPLAADEAESLAALDEHERMELWAVGWVLGRWLFDETCLRRSLAYGWFIRRRRPVLRLGMIDEGGPIAHAWVEAEGRAFDTTAVTGTFAAGAVADDASTPLDRPPATGENSDHGDRPGHDQPPSGDAPNEGWLP